MEVWDDLFFTSESPAVVALFRIAFGLVLVGDALWTIRDAPLTVHPNGPYDLATAQRAPAGHRLNLFGLLSPTAGSARVVVGVHLAASVAVLVGALTPLAAIVAFVTLTSIHHRDPPVLNSADSLLRMLLFWLILAPAGRLWSLDAAWFDLDADALVDPWALRLLQFQLLVVYLRTGWWKMRGEEWRDGSAAWLAFSCTDIRRHGLPGRLDRPAAYRLLTWGTVAFELAFPLLVWVSPLRYPLLAAAAGFHLGMHWFLRIRLFPWVMLAGLTLLLPPEDVAGWLAGP